MFTAKFDEPFTLTRFVRTSWLIGKRVVICIFFLIKKLPPDLASIVYLYFRLFLIKKIADYHLNLCMIVSVGSKSCLKEQALGSSTYLLVGLTLNLTYGAPTQA